MSDDNFEAPSKKQEINEQTGLPVLTEEFKEKAGGKASFAAVLMPIIGTAIGTGLSYLVYRFGDKAKYDERIDAAK